MSGHPDSLRPRFNLCGYDRGAGLSRDFSILRGSLAPLGEVELSATERFSFRRWGETLLATQLFRQPRFAATIFLETIQDRWLFCGARNFLIPNPEWLPPDHLRLVRQMDRVLCKTHDALRIFHGLGLPAKFIGFTSEDRWDGTALWTFPMNRALHVAGRSLQKGTLPLVEVWRKHPEWPQLVIVQRKPFLDYPLYQPEVPNIRWIPERIPDAELRELQNTIPLHICASEAEGFGHVLVESLSCGAVLITTDGPPMNEIVRPERGLLVRPCRVGKKLLGTRSEVDPAELEQACTAALAMAPEQREAMGRAARAWYLENDAAHRRTILAVISEELR